MYSLENEIGCVNSCVYGQMLPVIASATAKDISGSVTSPKSKKSKGGRPTNASRSVLASEIVGLKD